MEQENASPSTSSVSSPSPLSRRDVLTRAVPAIALAATVAGAAQAFGQNAANNAAAPGDHTVDAARTGSPVATAIGAAFKDGQYTLPPLAYGYDALEPHIDKATMELHHGKHQQAYVTNLNKAIAALAELRKGPADQIDTAKLSALERDISFNAGGHILHTVFFATMATNAGGKPAGAIGPAIEKAFGSFDAFKAHFSKVAAGVKGSGWALLVYEPIGDNLLITESGDQDLRMVPGGAPLTGIDVWEHAYYLKHQNKRADYITAWWNVVNWSAVDASYVAMRKMYGRA
jgi:Fe-Mn family superoxide dismutase